MIPIRLGQTDLHVSPICLGTMTFGQQVQESLAHQILDRAFERNIHFLDTAEMYPIGGNEHIFGSTERQIGTWLQKTGSSKRDELVIATKIAGTFPFDHQ